MNLFSPILFFIVEKTDAGTIFNNSIQLVSNYFININFHPSQLSEKIIKDYRIFPINFGEGTFGHELLSMDNFEVPEDNVIVEPEDPFLIPPTPNNEEIDPIFQKELDDLYDEISGEKKLTNIDSNESNSDWVKGLSWDLPTTAKDFINTIGGVDKWEHFQTLPAFLAMPEELKTEVKSYLENKEGAK
jgi:hypothetical protein